jgi:hypothetical protein
MLFVSAAGQPQMSRFEIMRQRTCLVVVVPVGIPRMKHGRLASKSHKYLGPKGLLAGGPTNSSLRSISIERTEYAIIVHLNPATGNYLTLVTESTEENNHQLPACA